MKLKIKIVMKFRGVNEVIYSIPAREAHKAYFLFLNPEDKSRTVFESGLAIKGEDIERIEPDVIGSMEWNQGYKLTPEDHADTASVKAKLEKICHIASEVGRNADEKVLSTPLQEIIKNDPVFSLEYKNVSAPRLTVDTKKDEGVTDVKELLKKYKPNFIV